MKLPWSMLGRRRHETPAPAARPRGDEHAYLLLEEARLRCLRLREADPRAGLEHAYREIGMAGYMASARIPSDRRLGLLSQARERSGCVPAGADGRGPTGGDGRAVQALIAVVTEAAVGVESALVAPGFTDHLQTAAEHLVRARVALGDLLAAPPPAAPAVRG